MALIASNSGGGKDFKLPEVGNCQGVCALVADIGMEWSDEYQKYNHKVVICWELDQKMEDGRPFMLSKTYTVSLNEKAALRRDLESWRGKVFTDEELKGFDLEKLIGANCLLNVVGYTKMNGKEGAKISSISPMMRGMTKILPVASTEPEWIGKQRAKNKEDAGKEHTQAPQVPASGPKVPAPTVTDEAIPF